ncbi:MAG: TFIIB-type zinc ribbon-containing protein [Lachnospiraceae bacterium]|nr:TFIIB-type zinc ribbon-containing protein [Lachnospiraceae bacterium]
MAAIIYKCPCCGGELVFDPAKQRYLCEYCGSDFDQQQLDELTPDQGEETQADRGAQTEEYDQTQGRTGKAEEGASAVLYSCPSCGAQIVTDETTAATFCFYCHNPVILSGRLSGEYLPDKIIPFAIDKKEATERFLNFVRKKKFVPKAFFQKDQIEKLSGVYYPYWVYDCEMDAGIDGEASRIRTWISKDMEYTETQIFHIERQGKIHLRDMTKNALQKSNKELVEGVQPFRMKEKKDFSMGYLSGFLAERRDLEIREFEQELQQEAREYSRKLLRDTVSGYSTVNIKNTDIQMKQESWQYLLLPVWVLTYGGRDGRRYYYAMNGQTGTICGKLPIDYKKLGLASGITGALVMLLCLIGSLL